MVISATTFTSQNTNNNLRDASFSSYLTNKEPFHLTRKEPFHLGVKKEEDGEIGVFDAEKYFNGVEIDTPIPRVSTIDANKIKYLKDQQQNRNYKVQYGTSSVGSESSVNSQSAFLQSALKTSSSSEISFNKSVVHGKSTSEKIIKHDQDSSNHSVKNKKTENPLAATELMMNKDFPTYKVQLQQVEKPRKKLEVFGSPILDERCNKSLSFDMRLKKPSWEASTKLVEQETEISTNCDESNYDDDVGSDASSDLFEIESLTG
ncbi:protein phytochrome kinase substrate 1-like, partial [Trifolium pratense]